MRHFAAVAPALAAGSPPQPARLSQQRSETPPWCLKAVEEEFGPAPASTVFEDACDLQTRQAYCAALRWQLRPPRTDVVDVAPNTTSSVCGLRSAGTTDRCLLGSERQKGLGMIERGIAPGSFDKHPAVVLGFVVLLQNEVEATIRLVSRLWRPEHFFVLHVDAKARGITVERLRSWAAKQGSNVEVLRRSLPVVRGGFSQLMARIQGLLALLQRPAWEFALLLTATHYPIRSVEHLERYLWLRNLSHIGVMPDWISRAGPSESIKKLGSRIAFECNSRTLLLHNRRGQPMHMQWPTHPNISFATGSAHAVLRRDFAVAATSAATTPSRTSDGPELASRVGRTVLALARLLVQPDEAFWQTFALNSVHHASAHLLCDLTAPIDTFGPEERRVEGAEFQIAAPRALGEADMPNIRNLQASAANVMIVFVRKLMDDAAGHRLRDLLDNASALPPSSRSNRSEPRTWALASRAIELFGDSNIKKVEQIEVRMRTDDVGLGPWDILLTGGRVMEVSYKVPSSEGPGFALSSLNSEWRQLEIQERLALPTGRDGALVAVRVGSGGDSGNHNNSLMWDILGGEVGCVGTRRPVMAAIYWAPRTVTEVETGTLLRGTFQRSNDKSDVKFGSLLRIAAGVGFTVGNLTLPARKAKPGVWHFLLEQLDDTWALDQTDDPTAVLLARVPFRIYKRPEHITSADFEDYFVVRKG